MTIDELVLCFGKPFIWNNRKASQKMTNYELTALIVQFVTTILVAGSVFYAAGQIKQNRRAHLDNHEWSRRHAAQEVLYRCNDVPISRSPNKLFEQLTRRDRITLNEIQTKSRENPDVDSDLHHLLNIYESLARGIFQGIFDEDVIKNGRKTSMIKAFDTYKEYIDWQRTLGVPLSWSEYEKLVDKWKSEDNAPSMRPKTGG